MSSADKVTLVTGSSSGIGMACARTLANKGCHVIMTGSRDEELVAESMDAIRKESGRRVHYLKADLTKVEEAKALGQKALELYPSGINILINNAGFNHVMNVSEYPDDTYEDMTAVMLRSPFYLTKALLPKMKEKGWGRIINVSSIMGHISAPGKAVYSSTKSGIIGMTRGIAIEAGQFGVTCNAVCPGFVPTPIVVKEFENRAKERGITREESEASYLTDVPTRKLITENQVADLVQFLCLSDASSQMTGSSYIIDGGYTAQ